METMKIAAIVTIIVATAAVVTVSAFVVLFNPASTPTNPAGDTGTNTGTSTYYPGGMMGGYGYTTPPVTSPTQPTTTPITSATTNSTNATNATSITMNDAIFIAQNYTAQLGNPNLAVKEVEAYTENFYFQVYEKDTGVGAFEMLINPYTGAVTPAPGANMAWNTKYGPMADGMMGYLTSTGAYPSDGGYGGMGGGMGGGMMGGGTSNGWLRGTPTVNMPVSADQAKTDAQQWLDTNMPGITVGEVFPFYGYYHVMAQLNGNNYGMMSVNGYTGAVWYHTWHGTFIQEVDLS